MNSTNVVIGLIVLVLIGGGVYYFTSSNSQDDAMHGPNTGLLPNDATTSAMMHDDGTSTDSMMGHDGDMMNSSTSVKVNVY